MPVSRDILPVIPLGEENAVTDQLLWKRLDLWSFASIKHKLKEMALAGLIQRKRVLINARPTSLYFRPSKPSTGF